MYQKPFRAAPFLACILALTIISGCNIPAIEPSPTTIAAQIPAITATPVQSAPSDLVIFGTDTGLWSMYGDGSHLTQLTDRDVVAPGVLSSGFSPVTNQLAYITKDANGSHLLILQDLVNGEIGQEIDLTGSTLTPNLDAEICDPAFEAYRALNIGKSVSWSPDGSKLATIAVRDGESADVYIFTPADGQIVRVSNEPGHAYDLHWSRDGEHLVYFSANCFGTGAGFSMEGVYEASLGSQPWESKLIYQPNPESWWESYIAIEWSGGRQFIAATGSGCGFRDIRLVDPEGAANRMIIDGCVSDLAVGPTSSLAIAQSRDFSSQPGVYLFAEPGRTVPPVFTAVENIIEVQSVNAWVLYAIREGSEKVIQAIDWYGNPLPFTVTGDFPAFNPTGDAWAWSNDNNFYLQTTEMATPILLSPSEGYAALWYESGDAYASHLVYATWEDPKNLYLAIAPLYEVKSITTFNELRNYPVHVIIK